MLKEKMIHNANCGYHPFQPAAKVNLLEHSTGRNAPLDMLHNNEYF